MSRSANHKPQMSTGAERGNSLGMRRSTLAAVYQPQDRSDMHVRAGLFRGVANAAFSKVTGRGFRSSGAFPITHTFARTLRVERRRLAGGVLPRNRLAVTIHRRAAFRRCPQFLRTACHICQDRTKPSPNHLPCLSSAVRYGPTVARGEKHDVPEIRASGTSNEC
jgi:hypothetical protein